MIGRDALGHPLAGPGQDPPLLAGDARTVAPYSGLMGASQALIAEDVLDACDLSPFRHLMDVGGGEGTTAEGGDTKGTWAAEYALLGALIATGALRIDFMRGRRTKDDGGSNICVLCWGRCDIVDAPG